MKFAFVVAMILGSLSPCAFAQTETEIPCDKLAENGDRTIACAGKKGEELKTCMERKAEIDKATDGAVTL